MGKKKKQPLPKQPRITNRKARHDYYVTEVVECGVELLGTEVKSLRAGQAKIDEAYARVRVACLALAADTRPSGSRKLTGRPGIRVRVGAYRVIYEIDDAARTVTILHVGHRRDVYR